MEDFKLDLGALDQITIPEVDSIESFNEEKEPKAPAKDEEGNPIDPEENDDLDDLESNLEPSIETSTDEEPLKELAKWGHELGIFDFDEDKFEATEEYFKNQFFEKVKKEAAEAVPEEYKAIMKSYFEGVPLNELLHSKARQETFESITDEQLIEDESLQENIVKQWLSLQDYEEDEILDKIDSYKSGLLIEKEAKTALKKLKKYEANYQENLDNQAKQERETREAQNKKILDDLKENINSTETYIPGISMDKVTKEKLYNAITKRDRDGKTELEKKMSTKEMQLAVAQFVLQLEGKVDAVERKVTTKVTKNIKETLNSDNKSKSKPAIDYSIIRQAIRKSKQNNNF